MKEMYTKPISEIEKFSAADILTVSWNTEEGFVED